MPSDEMTGICADFIRRILYLLENLKGLLAFSECLFEHLRALLEQLPYILENR